jgi:S1-C subfamily serine protease
MGVVSAVGPAWRTWHGGELDQFVRLDLAVYDGFSGGPLVDPPAACSASTPPRSPAPAP